MTSISRTGPSTLRKVTVPRTSYLQHNAQNRTFSSTSHGCAAARRLDLAKIAPKQQSVASRVKQMKKSDIPEDIGIIPGTFIRPTWKEGPSLLSSKWRQRLFIDRVHLKQSFQDFFAKYILYRWQSKDLDTNKKKKFPLDLRQRLSVAQKLHSTLYTSISRGDKTNIKEIACSGLANQQSSRIDSRRLNNLPPTSPWSCNYRGISSFRNLLWPLQFLIPNKSIKIVADRQVNLPFGDAASVRQFVVRIKSVQSLDKDDGTRVSKEMTEYMVVQRMIINQEIMDWKVWGTTKPSTYEDALEIAKPIVEDDGNVKLSFWDNIKMTMWDKVGRRISG